MISGIAPRSPERVIAKEPMCERSQQFDRRTQWIRAQSIDVFDCDIEKVGNRARFDQKTAAHVGFADPELGVKRYRHLPIARGEADRNRRSRPVAKRELGAVGRGDANVALAY